MGARALTAEYSRFMYQLGGSRVDEVCAFFAQFSKAMGEAGDFRRFIHHPAIAIDEKIETLQQLFGAIPETVCSLLREILRKRKIALIPEITLRLQEMRDRHSGLVVVSITSAMEVSDAQKATLEARMASSLGRKVQATYTVDASLVAGFCVQMGTTIIDNSVRNQFEKINDVLQSLSRG